MLPERRAMDCLQDSLERLNRELGREDPLPLLRFDLRGRSAGQARLANWCIRLNLDLLRQHGDVFIADTVPHELAHLVAYAMFGSRIRPHGKEWRALMQLLERPATVCHSYAVQPARRVSRYAYRCACRSHQLSSIRHRRILAGQAYACRRCGQTLTEGDAPHAAC